MLMYTLYESRDALFWRQVQLQLLSIVNWVGRPLKRCIWYYNYTEEFLTHSKQNDIIANAIHSVIDNFFFLLVHWILM